MKNEAEVKVEPYKRHIFVCTNQKQDGKACCREKGGFEHFEYLKTKLKTLDPKNENKIRVSQSGCLGKCSLGPCIVIYPEGVWFTFTTPKDLDQIIAK